MKERKVGLIFLIAVFALVASISVTSADLTTDQYIVKFNSHTFDGTYSTWCYEVTCLQPPGISHMIIFWCNPAVLVVPDGGYYYVLDDPTTGKKGIKFDDLNLDEGETTTLCFKLIGDYEESEIEVTIKAGADTVVSGYLKGPLCTSTQIPEFTTIAIPVGAILGLLFFFNHHKRR